VFANFFSKRAKYPRFKSKRKSRASAEYTGSAFTFRDDWLKIAKMAGPLDIVWWCDHPTVKPLAATDAAVGIDVGLDHLLALSTGEKIANPRHERLDRAHLTTAQRHCARKEKGSANRITDRRRDGLHKLTTRLVREIQTLVIEGLTVRNMVRNRKLARAVSDAAWAEFRSLLATAGYRPTDRERAPAEY
jgi:putative transposase